MKLRSEIEIDPVLLLIPNDDFTHPFRCDVLMSALNAVALPHATARGLDYLWFMPPAGVIRRWSLAWRFTGQPEQSFHACIGATPKTIRKLLPDVIVTILRAMSKQNITVGWKN